MFHWRETNNTQHVMKNIRISSLPDHTRLFLLIHLHSTAAHRCIAVINYSTIWRIISAFSLWNRPLGISSSRRAKARRKTHTHTHTHISGLPFPRVCTATKDYPPPVSVSPHVGAPRESLINPGSVTTGAWPKKSLSARTITAARAVHTQPPTWIRWRNKHAPGREEKRQSPRAVRSRSVKVKRGRRRKNPRARQRGRKKRRAAAGRKSGRGRDGERWAGGRQVVEASAAQPIYYLDRSFSVCRGRANALRFYEGRESRVLCIRRLRLRLRLCMYVFLYGWKEKEREGASCTCISGNLSSAPGAQVCSGGNRHTAIAAERGKCSLLGVLARDAS